MLKSEGFGYNTELNLNMGYYNIQLIEDASKICMIILPWGKYHYSRLTMVVSNYPNILHHNMNGLFQGFEVTRC